MLKPGGYAISVGPDSTHEMDTITCCHCQTIVFLKPQQTGADAGGFCRMCMKPICGPCADLGTCTPFEKKLEAIERADRLHQTVAKEMGW